MFLFLRLKRTLILNLIVCSVIFCSNILANAQIPIKVSLGEIKLKRGLIGTLFGSLAKKQLLNDKPFKKDLPTDRSFIIQGIPDFEKEKNALMELVELFPRR